MRALLSIPLLLLSACATFASLKSQTYIEPGKAFLLGGGQPGAFSVAGRNAGDVAVSVFRDSSGTRDSVTTLAPGASIDAVFPAGSMAVFRNSSPTKGAQLVITVRGDVSNLGMRYEPSKQ